MDPIHGIIVILVVGIIVWLLGLPGMILAGTVAVVLIALLLGAYNRRPQG